MFIVPALALSAAAMLAAAPAPAPTLPTSPLAEVAGGAVVAADPSPVALPAAPAPMPPPVPAAPSAEPPALPDAPHAALPSLPAAPTATAGGGPGAALQSLQADLAGRLAAPNLQPPSVEGPGELWSRLNLHLDGIAPASLGGGAATLASVGGGVAAGLALASDAARTGVGQLPSFIGVRSPFADMRPAVPPARPGPGSGGGAAVVGGDGWVWPLAAGGTQTSPPGPRQHPTSGVWACHRGEDIAAQLGTPIMAAHAGVVSSAGWNNGGYGNFTLLDHGNGLTSSYAHQDSIAVAAGQSVSAGQVIGYVGSTGDSTGPHLHFEIRIDGVAYLPEGWFGGTAGAVPC